MRILIIDGGYDLMVRATAFALRSHPDANA